VQTAMSSAGAYNICRVCDAYIPPRLCRLIKKNIFKNTPVQSRKLQFAFKKNGGI